MKRTPLAAAMALGMSLAAAANANEGMWMPTQLPGLAKTLKEAGFKGDPSALADVTVPPLSAVVRVGGGTGAFVSADGLLLTNHHVAYGVIQYNASKEHDTINDGFIAQGRDDERAANPDYRVLVTVGFDKVTDEVLKEARGKNGRAYYDAVENARKRIVADCEAEGGVRCSVANMYYGSDFYRIRQLELTDIRLVDSGALTTADQIRRTGLEGIWIRGPFSVQGEALQTTVTREGKPDYTGHGQYAMASWVLTGESRPYSAGAVANIKPAHNYGAVELVARYSRLDLDDADVFGGRQHDWTLGANWYLTSHFKFQANYVKADASRRGVRTRPEIVELRAQMHF